ncbi:MAG TPA: DUF423 domain-containing protein [Xanthomonadales bacterium]|nr:DUF423 domain-containing protein [Xanthomonadales bacterium]
MNALARTFGIAGALFGALAFALSAYVAHGAVLDATGARRAAIALAVLAAHGVALLALAALAQWRRGLLLALVGGGFVVGSAMFAGSLLAAALLGWRPALAPVGGVTSILAWLVLGVWFAGLKRGP